MMFHFDLERPSINQQDSENSHHKSMKTTRIIFIAFSTILLFQKAMGAEYNMIEVNQKIKAITDKRLHLVETALDEGNLFQSQELLNLQGKCSTDWMQIITNLEKIDGGDDAKKLAIYGLGQLSAQDYMTSIESLVTKYENEEVSENIVKTILYPMGRMGAFIKDNFSHARVIAVLNRIKAKSTNAAFKVELDNVLSGSAKSRLDNFRDAHQGMAEGNIPIVLLANLKCKTIHSSINPSRR